MKYELETLEKLVNSAVTGQSTKEKEGAILFKDEAWRTEKAIIHNLLLQRNTTLLRTYFTIHVQKLVDLSDRLFDAPDVMVSHPGITAILELLGALKKTVPNLIDRNIVLPRAFRVIQGEAMYSEWKSLLPTFRELGFSDELLEIAALPFEEFGSLNRKLSWFHFTWLKQYLSELRDTNFKSFEPFPSVDHLLTALLIRMDFNHPRLVVYCSRVVKENADSFESVKEQLLVLSKAKKIVKQFTMLSVEPFYQKQPGVVGGLCNWIDQEADFVKEYDQGVFAAIGQKVPVNPYKFIYDMNIEQLAFWNKLQYDHRVYMEKDLDSFSIKIAYNSSTKNKAELSVGSITSKMYTKDYRVISPVYEMVTAMMATIRPILELLQKMSDDLRPFMA